MPMRSYRELVAEALAVVAEVQPAELEPRLGSGIVVLDVREPDEVSAGVIPGSVIIARGVLERDVAARIPEPDTRLVIYCASGQRSALAALSLHRMGYTQVASLAGGIDAWRREGRPLATPVRLDEEQRIRYARHLVLPEVGEEGQRRLLESRVLLVGAGGLGSPAALYLAAAGVGTLGLVDFDVVDASNLQRQIAHTLDRLGAPKVESAREAIAALNPDVKVEPHRVQLAAANALDILSGYDVIVDGADNFPTRYLLNDASLHTRIPVVHGSIFRFEGQATVFDPYRGPCYRCLFPQPPPPELAPSCAEAGVLGVLPGVIGSLQALEVIKLILGIGDSLVGRLLTYDALEQDFRTLRLRRNPACPACGDEYSPPPLVDYDQYCLPGRPAAGA